MGQMFCKSAKQSSVEMKRPAAGLTAVNDTFSVLLQTSRQLSLSKFSYNIGHYSRYTRTTALNRVPTSDRTRYIPRPRALTLPRFTAPRRTPRRASSQLM